MYGRLTLEGKSYGWRDNISRTARNRLSPYDPSEPVQVHRIPGWSKYKDRGFEYIKSSHRNMDFELRTAEDSQSIFLQYAKHSSAPPDVVTLYTQVARSTAWYQVNGGTVPIHFPIKSTYNHDALDFGSWFVRDDTASDEMSAYMKKYIPHLQYRLEGTLVHINEPWL